MDNIIKENINRYTEKEENIVIYQNSNSIYSTKSEDILHFKKKEEEIVKLSKSLLMKMVMNNDLRAEELARAGMVIRDNLIKSIIIIALNDKSSHDDSKIEVILDEASEENNYFRRILSKYDIKISEKKRVTREVHEVDLKGIVAERDKYKAAIDSLLEREKILMKSIKSIHEDKDNLKLENKKLKEEMNKIKFKTESNYHKLKLDRFEEIKDLLPFIMDTEDIDMERVTLSDMEVSISKEYKDEILNMVEENPAIALEFLLTRIPFILPVVYESHKKVEED